jgi:molybdenum cofactor biosynthesis enzyme MoaA
MLPIVKELPSATIANLDNVVDLIRTELVRRRQSLSDAIAARDLYFRVSLVGNCNLNCPFCHNEGAPTSGIADPGFVERAMAAAREVGFARVQFTGGEPLLHKKVEVFVSRASSIFTDVGVTTNGTLLLLKLEKLIAFGITRIHISLQEEPLRDAGEHGEWGVPGWLTTVLQRGQEAAVNIRLNLPVPAHAMDDAFSFVRRMRTFGCDLKVFSVLPEGQFRGEHYPLEELKRKVRDENRQRRLMGVPGEVLLREYREPDGVRCKQCKEFRFCKEQSHSLRLGADGILRPCLATRRWDLPLREEEMRTQIEASALLAIDYTW